MKTLEGYGAEPRIRGMLAQFWARKEVFTQQNEYHGSQFRVTRGTTQGSLTFPTLLNVAVDNVVRHWLSMTMKDGLEHAVGRGMEVFYADDGIIASQDPEWI